MFLDRPQEAKIKAITKEKITLRVPDKLWISLQKKAKSEYLGRGKQSQLVNEALRYFFDSASIESINWGNSTDDYVLINLLTQVKLGATMKNLGCNPVQASIDKVLMDKLIDLELNIKGARIMLDVHIKPAILRIALSQWMYADRRFLKEKA